MNTSSATVESIEINNDLPAQTDSPTSVQLRVLEHETRHEEFWNGVSVMWEIRGNSDGTIKVTAHLSSEYHKALGEFLYFYPITGYGKTVEAAIQSIRNDIGREARFLCFICGSMRRDVEIRQRDAAKETKEQVGFLN